MVGDFAIIREVKFFKILAGFPNYRRIEGEASIRRKNFSGGVHPFPNLWSVAMLLLNSRFIRNKKSRPSLRSGQQRHPSAFIRPRLEALEDRTLPSGLFGNPITSATGSSISHFVVAGDFDGDGKLDLATINSNGIIGSSISVLLNNGDGTFSQATGSP